MQIKIFFSSNRFVQWQIGAFIFFFLFFFLLLTFLFLLFGYSQIEHLTSVDLLGLSFATQWLDQVGVLVFVMTSNYVNLILVVILDFVMSLRMIAKKD